LYRANRTTKINAEHFQAFSSFNYAPLAESGVHLKINDHLLLKSKKDKPLHLNKKISTDVALIKLFPGISDSVIESILGTPNLKGVILETFGSGNVFTKKSFLSKIEDAIKKGICVVVVTQCSGGGVLLGKYESSRLLKNLGVINGKDITTESAITKLMYLIGQNLNPDEIKSWFETSLRGEIT
jgi:L-asparaginase